MRRTLSRAFARAFSNSSSASELAPAAAAAMASATPEPRIATRNAGGILTLQGLIQIGDDIFRRLNARRETQQVVLDAEPRPVLRRQLAVRGHSGVKHHRLYVAQRRARDDHAQRIHEDRKST